MSFGSLVGEAEEEAAAASFSFAGGCVAANCAAILAAAAAAAAAAAEVEDDDAACGSVPALSHRLDMVTNFDLNERDDLDGSEIDGEKARKKES